MQTPAIEETTQDQETIVTEVQKTLDLVSVGEQLEAVGDAMAVLSTRLISLARALKAPPNTRPEDVSA